MIAFRWWPHRFCIFCVSLIFLKATFLNFSSFWFCDASKYIQYLPLFIVTSRPVLSSLVHWTPPWNDLEVEQSAPQWLHQSIGRLSHDPFIGFFPGGAGFPSTIISESWRFRTVSYRDICHKSEVQRINWMKTKYESCVHHIFTYYWKTIETHESWRSNYQTGKLPKQIYTKPSLLRTKLQLILIGQGIGRNSHQGRKIVVWMRWWSGIS